MDTPSEVKGIRFALYTNLGQTAQEPALVVLAYPDDIDPQNPMLEPTSTFRQLFKANSEIKILQYVNQMEQAEKPMR